MKKHYIIIKTTVGIMLILVVFISGCMLPPVIQFVDFEKFKKTLENENARMMIVPDLSRYPIDDGGYYIEWDKSIYNYVEYSIGLEESRNKFPETAMDNSKFNFLRVDCAKKNCGNRKGFPNKSFKYNGLEIGEFNNDYSKYKKIDADTNVYYELRELYPKGTSIVEYSYVFELNECEYLLSGVCVTQPQEWEGKGKEAYLKEVELKCKEEVLLIIDSILEKSNKIVSKADTETSAFSCTGMKK